MAFQIVEFAVDERDEVIERKVIAPPFETRAEAIASIESVISHYEHFGFDEKQDSWWARAANGDRMRFVVEGV